MDHGLSCRTVTGSFNVELGQGISFATVVRSIQALNRPGSRILPLGLHGR
ncbi:MAG: hypothetical protein QHH05_00335 [Syntrophomonadaceae bacterium]|jgi:hypothetical protein|nr:hypothetical protein [Syntrophomonadaceae bacterium]MDH7496885.1 hypothetical protein [Syntrophomonadaceae bacterium]